MMPMVKLWSADSAPVLDEAEKFRPSRRRPPGKIQQIPRRRFRPRRFTGVRRTNSRAQKNKPVRLDPVDVEVYEFRLAGIDVAPLLAFRWSAARAPHSLPGARTSASSTGSGAHLAEITRTAVGEFTLDHAVPLAEGL